MISATPEGLRDEIDSATAYFRTALEYLPEKRWKFHGPMVMPGNIVCHTTQEN